MSNATANPQCNRIAGRSKTSGMRTKSDRTFEIGSELPSFLRKSERRPNSTIWNAT